MALLLDTKTSESGKSLVIKMDGDLDVNSVRELKKCLEEAIESGQPDILLDCAKLNYIDSTGLGVLVSSLKKAQKNGGAIQLIELKPYLYKIFEVTGLTNVFEIEVAK